MNTSTTPAPAALFRPAQPFHRPLRRSPHPTPTPGQPGSRRACPALVAAPKSSVAHGRSDRCYTTATPARHRCAADFFPRLPATHNQHHSVSAAHRAPAPARTPPRSRPQLQRRSSQPCMALSACHRPPNQSIRMAPPSRSCGARRAAAADPSRTSPGSLTERASPAPLRTRRRLFSPGSQPPPGCRCNRSAAGSTALTAAAKPTVSASQ